MVIKIDKKTKIRDIQWQFHRKYPYLKLEFFFRPDKGGETLDDPGKVDPGVEVNSLAKNNAENDIVIGPWLMTGEVENKFAQAGLYPHVYRRNGYQWTQPVGTANLTLEEQNIIGKNTLQNGVGLWKEKEEIL